MTTLVAAVIAAVGAVLVACLVVFVLLRGRRRALKPDPVAAGFLPEPVCRHFRMLPISLRHGEVALAVANPENSFGLEVARALCPHPIRVVAAPTDEVERAIERVFAGQSEASRRQGPERRLESAMASVEASLDRMLEAEERLRAASHDEAEAATRIGDAERRLRGLIDS